MNSKKKTMLVENVYFEDTRIRVFEENDGKLYFEKIAKDGRIALCSNNYLEAVACLMKFKHFHHSNLWDIKVTNKMKDSLNYGDILYWLSGGDKEWLENNTYTDNWSVCRELFITKFQKKIENINESCKTLGEVRLNFLKYFNLPNIYNFSLKKNILN
jgi:hypothetical protein